jgi:hypothetical protein
MAQKKSQPEPSKPLLKPDAITLVEFKLIKGQLDSPFDFNIDNVGSHSSDVVLTLGFSMEDKLVKADLTVSVKTISESGNETEASGFFHFAFVYRIDNLDELVVQTDDGNVHVNAGLGNALSSITYSTSRGILMARFQGTALASFILPVIDPNSLLK